MTLVDDPWIARQITLIRAAVQPPQRGGANRSSAVHWCAVPCDIRGGGVGDDCNDVFWPEQKPWHGAMAHGCSSQRRAYRTISAGAFAALDWSRRSISGPSDPQPSWSDVGHNHLCHLASAQLLALFTLWTPSGIVWWPAEGAVFWVVTGAYSASWLILLKASFDAGAEVQSGALG